MKTLRERWKDYKAKALKLFAHARGRLRGAWQRAPTWVRYTTLERACVLVYTEARIVNMPLANTKGGYTSVRDIMEITAVYIAYSMPISGIRDPSTALEELWPRQIARGYFRYETYPWPTLQWHSMNNLSIPIHNLKVRRSDLRRELKRIRNYHTWRDNPIQ